MAVEIMSVSRTGRSCVEVLARQKSHCEGCSAGSACGLRLMDSAFAGKPKDLLLELPVTAPERFSRGESVAVSISDRKLMGLSLLLYLLPLACFVISAAVAEIYSGPTALDEARVIAIALLGLVGGFTMVRRICGTMAPPANALLVKAVASE